jgi:hypothetical protein
VLYHCNPAINLKKCYSSVNRNYYNPKFMLKNLKDFDKDSLHYIFSQSLYLWYLT